MQGLWQIGSRLRAMIKGTGQTPHNERALGRYLSLLDGGAGYGRESERVVGGREQDDRAVADAHTAGGLQRYREKAGAKSAEPGQRPTMRALREHYQRTLLDLHLSFCCRNLANDHGGITVPSLHANVAFRICSAAKHAVACARARLELLR